MTKSPTRERRIIVHSARESAMIRVFHPDAFRRDYPDKNQLRWVWEFAHSEEILEDLRDYREAYKLDRVKNPSHGRPGNVS